jgi:hypothetical protein
MAAIFIMIAAMLIQECKRQGTPYEQLQAAYLTIELHKLKKENSDLRVQQQQAEIKIASLEEEIIRLKEQLQLAQQRHFGNKRDAGESSANNDATEDERQLVAGYTRKKKNNKSCGRILDLSQLPQHIIEHDLNEADKICHGCGNPLYLIEKEKAAGQLEILPQRFYCALHVRYKYGCRACQTIHMAPKPPAPIPKALAGASVLAEVLRVLLIPDVYATTGNPY